MLDLESTTLSDDERTLLQQPEVGGVIFFTRNFESREQLCTLVEQIRAVRPELLLAVDQEGGRVQRFKTGFTRLPNMQQLGKCYREDAKIGLTLCRDTGWLMASELRACGLDISFAPVLDLDTDRSQVIGDRAFSDDVKEAVACATEFIAGMGEAGMAATAKHFPGHGSVVADSHKETPTDNRTLDEVRQRDMVPFVSLLGHYRGVMPAHILFPQVAPQTVGFSPFWLQQVLREELGFSGVIFSDDLSMKGADVAGGYPQKAAAALDAGCDMVLVCNNRQGALEVLAWLQQHQHPPLATKGIEQMCASGKVSWQQLQLSERYQRTQQQLNHLTAK
ncbi:beta-N-acetylhexosaminidase [bacterium SCSIO 12696]|nr:beta-N-acetylhexosaminidase [bacterium SCSIO 12696]